MTAFSHKLRTVALPDDLHARLRVEASRRAKDGEDVRAVAMDLVAGLLGPYLDELEAARGFLADRDIKPDNVLGKNVLGKCRSCGSDALGIIGCGGPSILWCGSAACHNSLKTETR